MSWRLAKSLETLRDQIDELAPGRDKSVDGTLGDAAHRRRKSDHNPDRHGVVRALDITHDPASGVDCGEIAEQLRQSRDPRIKYVIFDRQIFSATVSPWEWRPYRGSNPHTKHVHISVVAGARADDAQDWPITLSEPQGDARAAMRKVRRGDDGHAVRELQRLLGVEVDGIFGGRTEVAVWAFQAAHGLDVDGIVGPYTWDALLAAPAASGRQQGITATVFGGDSDPNRSAYETRWITDDELGVALPFRFEGPRPLVQVTREGRSVTCRIVDVGPWNIDDPYWRAGSRPQAESGTDRRGRRTNLAGIDLTPAAAEAIGLPGKGLVDWEFVGDLADPDEPEPPAPPPSEPSVVDRVMAEIAEAIRPVIAQHAADLRPTEGRKKMLKFMLTNWKTSGAGLGALGYVFYLLVQMFVTGQVDATQLGEAVVALFVGFGLLSSKDADVTGGIKRNAD